jgi:hypothetical protein
MKFGARLFGSSVPSPLFLFAGQTALVQALPAAADRLQTSPSPFLSKGAASSYSRLDSHTDSRELLLHHCYLGCKLFVVEKFFGRLL